MSAIAIRGTYVFSLNDEIHSQLLVIVKSSNFLKMIDSLDKNILNNITIKIYDVKWFCDSNNLDPEKLGFIYMKIFTNNDNIDKSSNIILLTGSKVAIYLHIIYKDKKYIVLSKQNDTLELLVDMLYTNEKMVGISMNDICIEAPDKDKLVLLGDFIPSNGDFIPDNGDFIAGTENECIKLLYLQVEIDEEKFNKISENTQINIIPEEEYDNVIKDDKTIIAHNYVKEKYF
jgi:hypothetical protein